MSDDHDHASKICPLTAREREVLTWVARGKSASEISAILRIAKRTVDEHAQSAFHKLGASNRVHAVAIALRNRFIEPEEPGEPPPRPVPRAAAAGPRTNRYVKSRP
jgi:DNA-binding CsgD family transcriptional regulator